MTEAPFIISVPAAKVTLRHRVHLPEAREVRHLPAGTEVVAVQTEHRVVLLAREADAVTRRPRALAMQATVGVVVVGALHDAVLPHDAPDAAQVVADVEVEGRQARRSIERGVAPVDEDLVYSASSKVVFFFPLFCPFLFLTSSNATLFP